MMTDSTDAQTNALLRAELAQLHQAMGTLEQRLAVHTQTERALHDSEQRFQEMAANIPGMLYQFLLCPDGAVSFPFASVGCRALFAIEPDLLQEDAMNLIQLIHPDDLLGFQQSVAHSAETQLLWQWEGRFVLTSGAIKWIKGTSQPGQLPDGAVLWNGFLLDITGRKRAESETRRSQQLLTTVIEQIPHMVIVKEASSLQYLQLNKAGEALLGYQRGDLIGKNDHELFPQAEADFFAAKDHEVLALGGVLDIPEEPVQTLYQGTRFLHTKKIPISLEADKPEYLLIISEDITERRAIEQALERSHAYLEQRVAEQTAALQASTAQLRAVLANVPIVVYTLDSAGIFTLSDGKGLASLGLLPDQVVGVSVFDLYRNVPETLAHLQAVLTGETRVWVSIIGDQIYNNHAMPLHDDAGNLTGLIGIGVDVTDQTRAAQERAELQEEIIRVQDATLRELSTPLIPLNDQIMVMPLIGAIDSRRAEQILDMLLHGVAGDRAQVAILDITGVPVVDTQVANVLVQAAQAVQLLGARVVLSGIRPEVAQTLVGLGVNLTSIVTRGTLQSAIAYALGAGNNARW